MCMPHFLKPGTLELTAESIFKTGRRGVETDGVNELMNLSYLSTELCAFNHFTQHGVSSNTDNFLQRGRYLSKREH